MRKIKQKDAKDMLNSALAEAKFLFVNKKYKESARLYSEIAKNIYYWENNVQGEDDDPRRQKGEGDNKVVRIATEQESQKT